MYRILDAGIEAEYFNIAMENVKFTTVATFLTPYEPHLETLELCMKQSTGSTRRGTSFTVTPGTIAVTPEQSRALKGSANRQKPPKEVVSLPWLSGVPRLAIKTIMIFIPMLHEFFFPFCHSPLLASITNTYDLMNIKKYTQEE